MISEELISRYIAQQRASFADKDEFWRQVGEMLLDSDIQILRRGISSLVTVVENGVERLALSKEG